MNLLLIIFLYFLLFTGTAKNHPSTEDFSRVLVPVNEEEDEEKDETGTSEHLLEASDGDNDALKLQNSLQSLREYLEMLSRNKNQEEPSSKEDSLEDNGLGPHYHTMNTNEPPMETVPEELLGEENVGDNPPKDAYFQPIPISDKINKAERNVQVGAEGGQQFRETVLLAVSSATLTVLLLLTIFCAVAMYYCSRPNQNVDDYSLSSAEKGASFCPSQSSYTRTEDSCLLWSETMEKNSSEPKHARKLPFSGCIDDISTYSDESARTIDRVKIEAECGLAPCKATPPSVPQPAKAAPLSVPLPPAEAAAPAPVPAEGEPPVPPPAKGASPPEAPLPGGEAPPPAQ